MSALAHWLEEEGLATTLVSLVRPQSDAVAPPRALWVPFELGRPLGAPDDPAFQRRVLMATLELLLRGGGPVLRAAFAEEAPGGAPLLGWNSPVVVPPVREPGALPVQQPAHLIQSPAQIEMVTQLFCCGYALPDVPLRYCYPLPALPLGRLAAAKRRERRISRPIMRYRLRQGVIDLSKKRDGLLAFVKGLAVVKGECLDLSAAQQGAHG